MLCGLKFLRAYNRTDDKCTGYRVSYAMLINGRQLINRRQIHTNPTDSVLNPGPSTNFIGYVLSLLVDVEPKLIDVAAVIKIPVTGPKRPDYQCKKNEKTHGVGLL
jgi:hypothetical protein